MKRDEVLVVLDFSENYKYVAQDASEAFHFNNSQCTVFPIVCYYKKELKFEHKSFIFLSNNTLHDTVAVYTVQRMLVPQLKKIVPELRKVIYFSDGAKQHFKNKYQMMNLIHHEEDFGVQAEWHFHAIAHDKSASDGIGAVFKREAVRASLLCKSNDAILSFKNLLTGVRRIPNVFEYCLMMTKSTKRRRDFLTEDLMLLHQFQRF